MKIENILPTYINFPLADEVNKYLDEEKPWVQIKDDNNRGHVQKVCTDGLNMFKVLAGYLKPIIPDCVDKIEKYYNVNRFLGKTLIINLYQKIDKFEPIINRIDSESIELVRAESGEKMTENKITIEDFIKLDLRMVLLLKLRR